MMMQTMRTKINWSNIRFWMFVFAIVGFYIWQNLYEQENNRLYRDVACPSLLSIARSSRDTLIVMKNVDACNDYMMAHLK